MRPLYAIIRHPITRCSVGPINCVLLVMTNPTWDPAEGTDAEEAAMDRAILPVTSDRTPITSQRVATLSKRWLLKPDLVEMTLGATTQLASRIWDEPRVGRYGHKFRLLGRKRLSSRFFTDTFFCKKSLSGFTCVQVFINDLSIVYIANMRSKGEAPLALRMFIDDVNGKRLFGEEVCIDQSSQSQWIFLQEEQGRTVG